LRIEQSPFRSGTNSRTCLERFHSGLRKSGHRGVHIVDFEEDVMNSATFLLEELFVGVSFPFDRLNELEFQVSDLHEGLAQFDALLFALVPIFRLRPVRPLDEAKWPDSK